MNLQCKILHVEDDDNDSFFFQRVLSRLEFQGTYRRVENVDSAINYLKGNGDFADRAQFPLPNVIVVDHAIPGLRSTDDLLRWLGETAEYAAMPVVMLTGAMNLGNQQDWLGKGVSNVLLKGASLVEMASSVEAILRVCVHP